MGEALDEFLERASKETAEISRYYRSDPTLPAATYKDIQRGKEQGIPAVDSYRVIRDAIRGQSSKPFAAQLGTMFDQAAIRAAESLKGKRAKNPESFWTKLNLFLGTHIFNKDADPLQVGKLTKKLTGKEAKEVEPERLTDQAIDILEFTQHLNRTMAELDYRVEGERIKPDLLEGKDILEDIGHLVENRDTYFSPKAWKQAWARTRIPERYFVGEEDVITDLPEPGKDIVKEMLAGRQMEDIAGDISFDEPIDPGLSEKIADNQGIDPIVVQTVLESDAGQKYAKDLQDRQVSIGRDIALGVDIEPGTKLFSTVSGTADAMVAIFGEPDFFVGEAIGAIRAAKRTIPVASKLWGGMDNLRTHPKMAKFLTFAGDERNPQRIMRHFNRKGTKVPAPLAEALAAAPDEDVAWEIIKRAALGVEPEKFIRDIPHTSVWAKVSDKLIALDVDADGAVARTAARLWRRAQSGWIDEPREALDPSDLQDAYTQTKGIINTFPKAFKLKEQEAFLERVLKAESADEVSSIVKEVVEQGGKALKVSPQQRKAATRLFDQYWKVRAFNISLDTGDELSTAAIETMNGMMEKAGPHLWSEGASELPLWGARELRHLRWGQGSFTKHFLNDSMTGRSVLGHLWMAPSAVVRGAWVPLILVTRLTAYPLRIQLDNQARLLAIGEGLANPRKHWRSIGIKDEFEEYVKRPARPQFLRHPVKYVKSLADHPDVPDGVVLSKQRLLTSAEKQKRTTGLFTATPYETDPHGVHGWQFMVEQLVEDPIARMFLGEKSMDDIIDWLRDDGNKFLNDLIRRKTIRSDDTEDIADYLQSVHDRITATVHGNEALENLMFGMGRGEIPRSQIRGKSGREFLQSEAITNPPSWVKVDVGWGTGDAPSLWARAQEVLFTYIMDIPDTRLARIPLYLQTMESTEKELVEQATRGGKWLDDAPLKERYTAQWEDHMRTRLDEMDELRAADASSQEDIQRLSSLMERVNKRVERGPAVRELDALAAEDGFVTKRMARESAKSHAVNRVIAILYDPTKRNRVERILATQMPFLAAYREVFQTWAKIMAERPQNIGRAIRAGRFMTSPVEIDDPYYSEGFDGSKSVPVSPFNWLLHNLTGTFTTFTSQFDSMNMITQNVGLPLGPLSQFMAGALATYKPGMEEFVDWVGGGWGLRYGQDNTVSGMGTLFAESFMPAWMRTAVLSVGDDPRFQSKVANEFRSIALEKWKEDEIPWDDRDAIEEVLDQATKQARAVNLIKSGAQIFWPGSIQTNYPHQPASDRYRVLRASLGPDAAMEALREELGPGFVFLTEGLTESLMPTTKKAKALYVKDEKARKLAQRYGGMFWALVEKEVEGENDFNVYSWQLSRGLRERKPLDYQLTADGQNYAPGWIESAQMAEAWQRIRRAEDDGQRKVEAGEISEDTFDATMKRVKTQMALEYPAWGISQQTYTSRVWKWRNLKQDMIALADGLGDERDSVKGLRRFIASLDSAQAARESYGLSPDTFDGTSPEAVAVRDSLEAAALAIGKDHPDFMPFYNRHLAFLLDPDRDNYPTTLERVLEEAR